MFNCRMAWTEKLKKRIQKWKENVRRSSYFQPTSNCIVRYSILLCKYFVMLVAWWVSGVVLFFNRCTQCILYVRISTYIKCIITGEKSNKRNNTVTNGQMNYWKCRPPYVHDLVDLGPIAIWTHLIRFLLFILSFVRWFVRTFHV